MLASTVVNGTRLFRHPAAGVMDDGAQTAAGVRLHLFGERQNAIVSAEIRVQTNGARFTQRVDGGIPCGS
jgi:hypothetical protein